MDLVTLALAKKHLEDQKGAADGVAAILDGALVFPAYTTILRPTVTTAGSVIFDSTLGRCILWNGVAWVNLDGSAL